MNQLHSSCVEQQNVSLIQVDVLQIARGVEGNGKTSGYLLQQYPESRSAYVDLLFFHIIEQTLHPIFPRLLFDEIQTEKR